MEIKILKPIGPCFGVLKAIDLVKNVINNHKDKNIILFGQIVHNDYINNQLQTKGVKIINYTKDNAIELLNSFTNNDVIIFSAHGHDDQYENILKDKGIIFYDATCIKVQNSFNLIKGKKEVIYLGKANHIEAQAALTKNKNIHLYDVDKQFDFTKIKTISPTVVNQTTIAFLDLKKIHELIKSKIPNAILEKALCDVVECRQKNILTIEDDVDLILVIGSKKSSNTNRLYELAKVNNPAKAVFLIDSKADLAQIDKEYHKCVITSGTSTPVELINEIINEIK